jgi:hypothetical protein
MILSLNEIETTILKAARGAGMEWGLAEEVGQAARMLARAGVAFEAAMLHLLQAAPWRNDFVIEGDALRPRDPEAWLCPIRVGACLSDLADKPLKRVERVLCPLLLLPFAARLGRSIRVGADGPWLSLADHHARSRARELGDRSSERAATVEIAALETTTAKARETSPRQGGVAIDMGAWRQLQAFEARTYVPASRRSRLHGAGAGAIDND